MWQEWIRQNNGLAVLLAFVMLGLLFAEPFITVWRIRRGH